MTTPLDNVIRLNDGIPPMGSPEFTDWLAAWQAENNQPRYQLTDKGRAVLKNGHGSQQPATTGLNQLGTDPERKNK